MSAETSHLTRGIGGRGTWYCWRQSRLECSLFELIQKCCFHLKGEQRWHFVKDFVGCLVGSVDELLLWWLRLEPNEIREICHDGFVQMHLCPRFYEMFIKRSLQFGVDGRRIKCLLSVSQFYCGWTDGHEPKIMSVKSDMSRAQTLFVRLFHFAFHLFMGRHEGFAVSLVSCTKLCPWVFRSSGIRICVVGCVAVDLFEETILFFETSVSTHTKYGVISEKILMFWNKADTTGSHASSILLK